MAEPRPERRVPWWGSVADPRVGVRAAVLTPIRGCLRRSGGGRQVPIRQGPTSTVEGKMAKAASALMPLLR